MNTEELTTDQELIKKLRNAPFFTVYNDAFRIATDLTVELTSASQPCWGQSETNFEQNSFCHELNADGPCDECKLAQRCQMQQASDRLKTHECFAGFKTSAVPVRLGSRVIGFLRTGQVLSRQPTHDDSKTLTAMLKQQGCSTQRIRELSHLYVNTKVIEPERYSAMMTLLSAFALQLASYANRILLESRHSVPEPVRKAKEFIIDRIDEKLTLEDVASEVHVSTFYLCKLFKQATGMTFTEFVNRQRIELAKSELLKANRRITEVAYDVGYQSLSQFNRSFLKIAGESPTQYRKHMLSAGNRAQCVA